MRVFNFPLTSASIGVVTLERKIADEVTFAAVKIDCTCIQLKVPHGNILVGNDENKYVMEED